MMPPPPPLLLLLPSTQLVAWTGCSCCCCQNAGLPQAPCPHSFSSSCCSCRRSDGDAAGERCPAACGVLRALNLD